MKRTRAEIDDTVVLVTVPRNKNQRVVVQNLDGKSFSKGDDQVYFAIAFDPPLSESDAKKTKIQITHQSKHKPCIDGVHVRVLGSVKQQQQQQQPAVERVLGKRKYNVFETHAVELDHKQHITKVFLQCEDNQLHYKSNEIVLHPHVDMGHSFLSQYFGSRYKGLDYFPPDVTVMSELGSIRSEQVPQRTPLWFKLRGEVSGSKAYTLLGFYVPEPGTPEAQGWSLDKPKTFNRWSRLNMRFGTLHEDYMVIAYLLAEGHEKRRFEEVGWCNAPSPPYPPTWGASPDGIVYNPDMKWKHLPEDIRKYYKPKDWDVTKGVVEFKASRNNCRMQAYYYPQMYMEMIAAQTLWADLVRYSETREVDTDGSWRVIRTCRIFRVYRHKKTEDLLVQLLKQALSEKDQLIQLVTTKAFCNIRTYFTKLAETAEYREIPIDENTDIGRVYQAYEKHKRSAIRGYLDEPDVSSDHIEDGAEQLWDDIEKNNMDMYRLFEQHNVKDFSRLYTHQVHMYTQLMDLLWQEQDSEH